MPSRALQTVLTSLICLFLFGTMAHAQGPEVSEGTAIVTQFSGVTTETAETGEPRRVLDVRGSVVKLLDVSELGGPAQGQSLAVDEVPLGVTAGEIGQVFGIAYDDADPANLYLTATSAFGLHRTADGTDWMPGMWGRDAGPGTVWKLNADEGYAPEVFAQITADGRENTGAALGNIAFDPWNHQFYVSDLETGYIHRLDMAGEIIGRYDHGVNARRNFVDARTGRSDALAPVAFDPESAARVEGCPLGDFSKTPACWNVADFRRRVWGVGVHQDPETGEVRLYYSVWSSQPLGSEDFEAASAEETLNTIWSVAISADGGFDLDDIRREFALPAFFAQERDVDAFGVSHPVSDIAFSRARDASIMLLAERGGLRNLGLDARAAFTHPHGARVLRYAQDEDGVWQPAGRYDVGYYDRARLGPPHIRANAAGGVDFGFGYTEDGDIDTDRPEAMVWMTGDALCTPEAPCRDPETGQRTERTQVDGLQATPVEALDAVAPEAASEPYPTIGPAYPPEGPDQSYMIEPQTPVLPILITGERDDTSRIGDVAFYRPYPGAVAVAEAEPPLVDWGIPEGVVEEPWWPEPLPVPDDVPPVDLSVQKAIPAPCVPGGKCPFVIIVTNTGDQPYTDPIMISDVLANGWTLAAWGPAGSAWECQQDGSAVSCMHPDPDLSPGESGAVTIELVVPPAQVSGQWDNCAVLEFPMGAEDDDPTNDEGCAPIAFGPAEAKEPVDGRDLAMRKMAGNPTCTPGVPCSFTVEIANRGSVEYSGPFRISETMPEGWRFGGLDTGWWCLTTAGGGPLVSCWRDITLKPGEVESLNVTLIPRQTGAHEGRARNCVAIDWTQIEQDHDATNDSACAEVELTPAPAPEPPPGAPPVAPTGEGMVIGPESVGYDLRITKDPPHSAQAAAPGAAPLYVCAPLKPCPFVVTITNQGVKPYQGPFSFTDTSKGGWSYGGISEGWSCDEQAGGGFACSGQIDLAPGESETLSVQLEPMAGVPVDPVAGENCVEIDWAAIDEARGKTGPPEADERSDNDRDCTPVVLDVAAPSPPPGADAEGVPPIPEPDINVRKRAATDSCEPGKPCWFIIVIEGTTDIPFEGAFSVTDIPKAKHWTFAGGGRLGLWSCDSDKDGNTTCTYDIAKNPNLPAEGLTKDDRVGFDIAFDVPPSQPLGTVQNCVLVSFPPPATGEMSKSTKVVCADVLIANQPKLTIAKHFDSSTCSAGGACNFIVTVKNEGKGPYDGLLTLWDRPGGAGVGDDALEVESVTAPGWECRTHQQEPSWTEHGRFLCYGRDIEPGETVIFTAKASLDATAKTGEIENCGELHLTKSDPGKLSQSDRAWLVRRFLTSQGYQTTPEADDRLSDQEKKALADYKTKNPVFSDTSGEITDEFLGLLTPSADDASGKDVLEACDSVEVMPNLTVKKEGPSSELLLSAEGFGCRFEHRCGYDIIVSPGGDQPYQGPITLREELPKGWVLDDYFPKSATTWTCTGSNPVECKYPNISLAKGQSATLNLTIKPTTSWYTANKNVRHPWVRNCSYLLVDGKKIEREPYRSCYRMRLSFQDLNEWDYDPTGTGSCTPPNCSFYQFTATAREEAYRGPIRIEVDTPPGSDFPEAEIVDAPDTCAPSQWTCSRTGGEFGDKHICGIEDPTVSRTLPRRSQSRTVRFSRMRPRRSRPIASSSAPPSHRPGRGQKGK
ncbi:hypothetical protein [Dichotomicrobium thermohalophilum]|uniref:DUF11 domain-containing protein n=1 Tax=Dichotomicrobium thermohalophilum TaxID=933063 RepID=A0A397Q2S2_9HYPH|nr:hypothetical protein [Dichotomicrobium thermohalophilum]RIA55810.1 hypothetical protein BXY53_0892 [Dichotomicrobium thermohalophilum]